MTKDTVEILEEFADDIQKVCEEVQHLRDMVDERDDEISRLLEEVEFLEASNEKV